MHFIDWTRLGRFVRGGVLGLMAIAACRGLLVRAEAEKAKPLSNEDLLQIQFDQRLESQVSLHLLFRDETGQTVRLGDFLGHKPAILVLGYYNCPMLCTLVLNGLVECLLDLRQDIGKQFEVISVSIDPHESNALAAAKKKVYLRRYGRHGAEAGWHFLTGEEAAIRQLAGEIGFRYAYDPASRQFAHPSGLVLLTPGGVVSRYFFGVNFSPRDLNSALQTAGAGMTGSRVQQLFFLCFHYNPLRGKYGALIMTIFRVGGLATVLALLATMIRIKPRTSPASPPSVWPAASSVEASISPGPGQPKGGES